MYRDIIEQVLRNAGVAKIKATHEGFTSCCPFHTDRSASFAISEEGLYICYSAQCGATGNLYKLLTTIGGYDHKQAVDLIGSAPIIGDASRIEDVPRYEERKQALKAAKALEMSEVLVAAYSGIIPKYMVERGFTIPVLRTFEIGFDRGSRQVVIPIRDVDKKLVGLVRRSVDPEAQRRYIIDVPQGDRGALLFNIHRIRGRAVTLVEGPLDCMWLWQKGIRNGVALLGSSLTNAQEAQLKARFDTFLLCLDMDASGRAATEKIIPRLRKWGDVFVAANLPKGKDAQDNTGLDLWKCLRAKVPGPEWLIQHRLAGGLGA